MIETNQAHLDVVAASHPGMTGKKNEDRYATASFLSGVKRKTPSVFAVLSDGIGGHRAGEVAAQMAVTWIKNTVEASAEGDPLTILEEAINRANCAIYEASFTAQGCQGMGATCACAWIIGDRLYTANLGDSRIYMLREGHIMQLTTDHTWVQEAYDAGLLDEAQGAAHPNAHVIRRYLGSPKSARPDFRLWFFEGESDADALENQGLTVNPGDVLLICSDGLTDLVNDDEIKGIVQTYPFNVHPNALIDLANARGGHDNITVVLMKVPGNPKEKAKLKKRRRWLRGCLTLGVILFLLAAGYFVLYRWKDKLTPLPTPTPQASQTLALQNPLTEQEATLVLITPTPGVPVESPTLAPSITPWPTNTLAP